MPKFGLGNSDLIMGWLSNLKALTDHLGRGSRVGSFDPYWYTGGSEIFFSHFKWISSQDQQKTNRCRLIIYKVTLTDQSHFMRIFYSAKSLYAITLTPYDECTQLVQKILWFNWMKVTLRTDPSLLSLLVVPLVRELRSTRSWDFLNRGGGFIKGIGW